MTLSAAPTNVSFRFLLRRTAQILCSRCLKGGRHTPVEQVLSPRHRPLSLCRECRSVPTARAPAAALDPPARRDHAALD